MIEKFSRTITSGAIAACSVFVTAVRLTDTELKTSSD
jgi:hypothetical protein